MAGKLVIARPQQPVEIVDWDQLTVELHDLLRLIGCDTVDRLLLGPVPGSRRMADIWFDDNGLLDDAVPANRNAAAPEQDAVVIAGTILACALVDGESVPLTASEAETVRQHLSCWEMLPLGYPKPEPKIEVVDW